MNPTYNSLPESDLNSPNPRLTLNGYDPSTPLYYEDHIDAIGGRGAAGAVEPAKISILPRRVPINSPTPQPHTHPPGSQNSSYSNNYTPVQLATPQAVKIHYSGGEDGLGAHDSAQDGPIDGGAYMEDIHNINAASPGSSSGKPSIAPRGRLTGNDHFPAKLYRLLDDKAKDSISWARGGKGFIIPDRDAFVEQILKADDTPFKTRDFNSFVRVANGYGFSKVRATKGLKQCEFVHKDQKFQKGRPGDLKHVTRKIPVVHPSNADATNAPLHSLMMGAQSLAPVAAPLSQETIVTDLQKQIYDLRVQQKQEMDELRAQLKQESREHQQTKDSLNKLWASFQNGQGLLRKHCFEARFGSSGIPQSEAPGPAPATDTSINEFRQTTEPISEGGHPMPAGVTLSFQLSTLSPSQMASAPEGLSETTAHYPTNAQRPDPSSSHLPALAGYLGSPYFDPNPFTIVLTDAGSLLQLQPTPSNDGTRSSGHAPEVATPVHYSTVDPRTMNCDTSTHSSAGSRNCGPAQVPRPDSPNQRSWF
ncbi:hypothetical protein FRB96_002875 [Tulasnella sp. 330]|nr:hypothetical protein FRB96_002875 [Tulasnella sp. 330]KAG8889279.1 hypothetical protein FRB98_005092 [Tulasnella sp. 332]